MSGGDEVSIPSVQVGEFAAVEETVPEIIKKRSIFKRASRKIKKRASSLFQKVRRKGRKSV